MDTTVILGTHFTAVQRCPTVDRSAIVSVAVAELAILDVAGATIELDTDPILVVVDVDPDRPVPSGSPLTSAAREPVCTLDSAKMM
ncbi:hypothetical protein [Phytoactinopolyspora endophytica]|uniref:hypothetical protein n=1 Tax=Phytoactinopolyspora endophytica TaxID=1642495 RepID=UPI00101BD9F5|nr:hypothetical protein [Phytoactinopolyspora endophytica]